MAIQSTPIKNKRPKVAIVHDWLPVIGGAEKVLEHIVRLFPEADIYTLFNFLSLEDQKTFGDSPIHESYLSRLPGVRRYYRKLLPLMPQAIENFDLSSYDLVISSSCSVAKGVLTGAHQTHVSYVHSPARYAWDLSHAYLKKDGMDRGVKGFLTKYFLKSFRIWDYRTANGVDQFIANSAFIKKRIWKVYRRKAEVIYPPIDLEKFCVQDKKEDFYLTASRHVSYKRIDLIVEAFTRMPERKLVVIGDGPELSAIKKMADGHVNIKVMGYQPNHVLYDYMQRSKGFIFAAEEDFGIIPVEAQACGTPVIAYGAGGALETVIDFQNDPKNATGAFFEHQTADSLCEVIKKLDASGIQFNSQVCRANAERFSVSTFQERFMEVITHAMNSQ